MSQLASGEGRTVDLVIMRHAVRDLVKSGLGWEDIWREVKGQFPPSISAEDLRQYVIPRLNK
jgi:hypothetical protein